jgi:hypothetical protein
VALVLLPLGIAVVGLLIHGPMPQDVTYHDFADHRSWIGIANAGNVLSNAFFLLAGALGLGFVAGRRSQSAFLDPRERTAWAVFFVGVTLTAFGSSYYHLAPGNDRLFWDRLPMTLAFMSLFAAVIGERLGVTLGSRLHWPLLLVGAGSVILWRLTEQGGHGDVRLYGLVEFYTLVAIPLLILLFPARYTGTGFLWSIAGVYGIALLFDALDRPIWRWTGTVSGHTLKHATAAAACFLVIPMLSKRSAATPASETTRPTAG